MATQILNAQGEPYFGTAGLDISTSQDADWIRLLDYGDGVVSLSCELAVGAAVSGDLYAEVTAEPQHAKGISRVVLPAGCLHTNAAGITLPTTGLGVNLASAANGATFTVSFSAPAVGWLRWRWTKGSGGGAPNRMYGFMQAMS